MELRGVRDKCAIKFVFVNEFSGSLEFFRGVDRLAMFLVNAHDARDQLDRQIDGLLGVIHDCKDFTLELPKKENPMFSKRTLETRWFPVQDIERVISVQKLFEFVPLRGTASSTRIFVKIHARAFGCGRLQISGSTRTRPALRRSR
jgi:hypothetical protein